jgi:glycosyl transferase family 87
MPVKKVPEAGVPEKLPSAAVAEEKAPEGNEVTAPTRYANLYYVKALAMALPAIMLGFQISGWIFFFASIRDGHPDFRANYSAGYMARTGELHQLYDYEAVKSVQDRLISREYVGMPFIHPAYESLFYVPFSLLTFHWAYTAFLVTNLSLVLLCYRLLRHEMQSLKEVWRPLPLVLFLTYLPIGAALMQGQDSIILLTLNVVAFSLLDRGDDLFAGLALGLGMFRFQLIVPVALLFLLWRRWRFVGGIALSGALVSLLSVRLVGIAQTKFYITSLASMSVGGGSRMDRLRYSQPVSHMGNLRALVVGILPGQLPHFLIQAAVVVLSLVFLFWVAYKCLATRRNSDLLPLAIATAAIVSYHMFIHDMSILVIPIAVWLNRSLAIGKSFDPTGRRLLFGSALMFAAPAMIVFAPFHFYFVCLAMIAFVIALVRFMCDRRTAVQTGLLNPELQYP